MTGYHKGGESTLISQRFNFHPLRDNLRTSDHTEKDSEVKQESKQTDRKIVKNGNAGLFLISHVERFSPSPQ